MCLCVTMCGVWYFNTNRFLTIRTTDGTQRSGIVLAWTRRAMPSPALMRSLRGFRSETNTLNKLLAIYWRSIGDLLAIRIGDLVAILFFAGIGVFRMKKAE